MKLKHVMLCGTILLLTACGAEKEKTNLVKQKLDGENILVSTLSVPPSGWVIAETYGMTCQVLSYAGHGSYAEKVSEEIETMKQGAKENGANMILNFSITAASYEQQGSKWHTAMVHICGESVKLS